jgi:hypothetical protein
VKIFKTLRKISFTAATLLAVLALVFSVNRTIEVCLCDTDPDECGEHCHECLPDNEEDCSHVTIEARELDVPQTISFISQIIVAVLPMLQNVFDSFAAEQHLHPKSSKPPDIGYGLYIDYSPYLYPLS